MKLIKCMLKKHRTSTETSFQYPKNWDAQKINVVAYEDSDKIGEVEEYCIGIIHEDDYADKLITSSSEVEEIDEDSANLLGEKAKERQLMIDEQLLPEILLALSKSPEKRSKHEENMLDPNDPTEGIRLTRAFNIRRWFPGQ